MKKLKIWYSFELVKWSKYNIIIFNRTVVVVVIKNKDWNKLLFINQMFSHTLYY